MSLSSSLKVRDIVYSMTRVYREYEAARTYDSTIAWKTCLKIASELHILTELQSNIGGKVFHEIDYSNRDSL